MLKTLVDQVSNISSDNNKKIRIKSVSADGAYDTNNNFRYLEVEGIRPGIKERKNSVVLAKNNKLRNKEVLLQTKDL